MRIVVTLGNSLYIVQIYLGVNEDSDNAQVLAIGGLN